MSRTRALALLGASLAATLPPSAAGAPRRPSGGVSRIYVLDPAVALDPRHLEGTSDVAVVGLVYETLYAIESSGALRPVLARAAPELRGSTLWVPLRSDVVFHDGRALTPALLRDHFVALAAPDSPGAFVMAAVRGGIDRWAGRADAEVRVSADADGIAFELIAPSMAFARLLAAPESAIIAPREGATSTARPPGTGPFFVSTPATPTSSALRAETLELVAFSRHHEGRPFLDAIEVSIGSPRRRPAPRGTIVLGPSGVRGLSSEAPIARPASAPVELITLSIGDGDPTLATPAARRALDQALDRATLARRFLAGGAAPATTLVFDPSAPETPAGSEARVADRPVRATLLVSSRDPEARRVADRIQLDLLRAGVTVVIEPLAPTAFAARRSDRGYDLMVARARVPGVAALETASSAIDALAALLALGQSFGVRAPISETELIAALQSPEALRRVALALERRLRLEHGILPLARRAPELRVDPTLRDHRLDAWGGLDLADAYLERADVYLERANAHRERTDAHPERTDALEGEPPR